MTTPDTEQPEVAKPRFALPSRILHWLMAPMVIAQLFIGITMVASLSYYPLLLAIHRPLGFVILVFAVLRLANRLTHALPPFLPTMRPWERRVSSWSERLLYALLIAQPIVGWAMVSATGLPITMVGDVRLPPIAPRDLDLYGILRVCHGVLAYLLYATFTAHVLAVLFHTLVIRDHIIDRMTLWPSGSRKTH